MTPYQLKKSILLKGVKGRLVDQIASEGTGRDVLTKSSEIREKIIKTEKLKSPKEIKAIDESTEFYFDIPDTWEWERFGNLVINYDSKRKPVAKELRKTEKGTYDYYGATGAIDKVDEYIFDGEYLMIGEDGGNFFVDRDNSFVANGQFWANNHVHVVKPALCDIFFLKYFLDCLNLPGLGLINGIAVPKLNQENLNSILVPVPPLEEQHRIVAKIEELLPYVDRYAEAYEKLEQFNAKFPEDMKKSILQYAIQGKLVEQRPEEGTAEELYQKIQDEKQRLIKEGKIKKEKPLAEITEDEIPFDIPESWKWVKLGDCTSYAQSKEKISPPEITNDMWSLDLEDIQKETGTILVKTLASERKISGDKVKFRKGQVLYSKLRPYLKKILVAPDDGICTPELVPFNVYGIDANYISYVLKSPHVDYIINTATYGVKMPRVGTDTMINLLIPLPPLEEQHRIVAKIEELLPYCDRLVK